MVATSCGICYPFVMANVNRVRVVWSGPQVVGGGVSTLYVDEAATGYLAPIRAFFDSIKNVIQVGVQIDIPPSGDLLDVATGALSGTWSEVGVSTVVASGTGSYIAGTGCRVRWATSGIRNGRRVRGTTFIAPMPANAFDGADGTPSAATITTLTNAANTLRAAVPGLQVYSRPIPGLPGQVSNVVGSDVPNLASWLRSRRV